MALIVLLLLLQQTHFSHQQTPFAPLDSSMRSLTMLARDFPSIEAVPDATFGEFQEVRLPEPRTPQAPPPPTPRRPSPTPRRPSLPSPTQRRPPPPPSPTQRRPPPPPPPPPQTSPAPPRNNSPFTNFGQTPTPTRLPPRIGSPAPGGFSGSGGGVTGGGVTGGG